MTLSVAHLIIDTMFAILNLRQGKIRSNIMLFYLTLLLIDIRISFAITCIRNYL